MSAELIQERCRRCNALRGKRMAGWRVASWERYAPFCSYHCQALANLDEAAAYLRERGDE